MDSATLVTNSIESGKQLIAEIEKAGLSVDAALWHYDAERDSWKLILASKRVRDTDVRDAYRLVWGVLHAHPDLRLDLGDIVVTDTSDDLIKLLRKAVRTGPEISEIRFSRNVIDGVYIDDAIIYRMP